MNRTPRTSFGTLVDECTFYNLLRRKYINIDDTMDDAFWRVKQTLLNIQFNDNQQRRRDDNNNTKY